MAWLVDHVHVVAAEVDWVRESCRQAVEDGRNGGQAEQGQVHGWILELGDCQDAESMKQPVANQDDEVSENLFKARSSQQRNLPAYKG